MRRTKSNMQPADENLKKLRGQHSREVFDVITSLQLEITRRENVEQKLREAEERYRIIFEEAMDAIVLLDPASAAIRQFNGHACSQLGYSPEEFKQLTLFDIEAQEDQAQLKAHIYRILAHGAESFETFHKTKSGALRNVLVSARPILLSGEKFLLAIFHDYTEHKQTENDLRAAVVHLEQHSQAKSEFVANVSHELKTPITSMMYGVRNLLKGIAGPLPDYAVRYLRLFDTECQRLVTTINDILDLGKLDNQTLSLSPITAPLNHLVSRCIDALRPQVEAAQLSIEATFDPACRFVRCDTGMIQRVLQNIIGNAVKFTPRGGFIHLAVTPDPDLDRFARVTISDNGTGIPPDALPHITKRYFKANNHASGSGLGLAISKEIIMLHGGQLFVCSPPPGKIQGTSISISLPLAPAPYILIADDDRTIQMLLKQHLTNYGYHVITADSGQEAILMAEAHHPNLVLIDLILEDIHGTTVILALKSSRTIPYTPIIAITGATLDEATTNVLARFTIPTVAKPWKISELMDTIETALLGLTAFQPPKTKESH